MTPEGDAPQSRKGANFTAPESGIWPSELLEREQWMCHDEKKPFAPWADCDHPEAAADEDARWKWGLTENYVDGATVALAEDALPTRANRGIVSKTGDSVDVSRDSAEGIDRMGRGA